MTATAIRNLGLGNSLNLNLKLWRTQLAAAGHKQSDNQNDTGRRRHHYTYNQTAPAVKARAELCLNIGGQSQRRPLTAERVSRKKHDVVAYKMVHFRWQLSQQIVRKI